MNPQRTFYICLLALAVIMGGTGLLFLTAVPLPRASADGEAAVRPAPLALAAEDPSPPDEPVKLIFIHHSCGENWLNDSNGGLGIALRDNNYFVSDTNYGWGPDAIGDRTDVGHWYDWFVGPNHITYTAALYAEYGQHSTYSRLGSDPGGPNEIIMFKSCYPNSHMGGNPNDPPTSGSNPLRGQDAYSEYHTVANVKGIYNDILTYFATRQDKLFVVVTAPPLMESETDAAHAANARAVNDWLLNDWLSGYAHDNVAVFDFYNVLTSNGGDPDTNDYDARPVGNHHYWNGSQITHTQTVSNNFSAYPSGDSHPTAAGNQKATAEFVPLLNVYYNRWQGGGATCTPLTGVTINGPTTGYTNTAYTFEAVPTPSGASTPITYTWSPAPDSGQGTGSATYTWAATGTWTITLTAENCGGSGSGADTHAVAIRERGNYRVFLPLVLRDYAAAAPACAVPLTGVTISGATTGYTDTLYTFTAAPTPANATTPVAYTWTPAPQSGHGTSSASYQWATTGAKTVSVTASNCAAAHTASDDHMMTIQAAPSGDLVQPGDFTYLGAFRLPGDDTPPQTFAYGGNAMTFNPDGDSGNGSLFIMGHDRQPWGGLPDGGQVAELSIPTPVDSQTLDELNTAAFIQNFANVAEGYFTDLEELPRTGMAYLNHPDTGPLIHLSWGQHHKPDVSQPSYAWFSTTLTAPDLQGLWYIGDQDWYSLNGYLFEIPAAWADAHAGGRYLGTGRQMDGGWGGMGPSLFAYRPWQANGSPIVSGTHLSEAVLLLYEDTQDNGDVVQGANTLAGHQHPDEWEGGAWITTPLGKSAVLFVGNKGTGAKYWYGYRNPAGAEYPCVNAQAASEFTACRLADGSPCPAGDMVECEGHTSAKGWWCAEFTPRFLLYNPDDLAQVAAGVLEPWEPQPYAYLDVGAYIFDNPAGVDLEMLGEGIQRRYLFGAAAYDRARGRLFVLELFADETKPVVHVWQVE